MKIDLTNNLFLKVLSLAAAIVLWVTVLIVSDGETSKTYYLDVTLLNTEVLTEDNQLFRVEDNTDAVKLTVHARKSVLEELDKTDFTLTADMENLRYNSLVTIDVHCKNKNIDVEQDLVLKPANVKVSIEESATEQFQIYVESTGTLNEGLVVGELVPEQTVVKITGPESTVRKIKKVTAVVDVTGLPNTVTRNCSLKLTDGDGDLIDTTYLNYVGKTDGIDVRVSLLKTKTVPLKFSYTGTPAEQYEVKKISWKPQTVKIAANESVLSGISRIEIPAEAVNVEGIDEELQLVIDLEQYLPSGVILPDKDEASILVVVELEKIEAPEENGESLETEAGTGDAGGENADPTKAPEEALEPEDTSNEQENPADTESVTDSDEEDGNNNSAE